MDTVEITKMAEQFRQEKKGGSQLKRWESISQHGEPWGCINCVDNIWEQRKLVLPKFMRDKTHDDNDETKWYNKWEIMKLLMKKRCPLKIQMLKNNVILTNLLPSWIQISQTNGPKIIQSAKHKFSWLPSTFAKCHFLAFHTYWCTIILSVYLLFPS